MKTFRILILEDDIQAVSLLTKKISKIETTLEKGDIAVTVLAEYTQVEEYINHTKTTFDVILLDRDCKACGSFHILDFEKFGVDKIISISAIPQWNKEAQARGVKRIILKDLTNLEQFADNVCKDIEEILKIKS